MRTPIRLAVVVALAACGGGGARTTPGTTTVAPADRGPPIAMHLAALDGGELDLATLRGKIVVLHVFTTWALAAQAEIADLVTADATADVVVVGIALDPDGRALVAPWRNGAGATYLITLADAAIRDGSGPLGRLSTVPMTFIIAADGRLHTRAERALAPGELATLIDAARRP